MALQYPDVARLFLAEKHEAQLPGGQRLPTLRWAQGSIYKYAGDHYEELDPKKHAAALIQWLALKQYVTLRDLREVDSHVMASLITESPGPLPAWAGTPRDGRWLAFKNGILDLTSLLETGTTKVVGHTPEWFSTVVLPYPFDPKATCPTFLRCLNDWFPGEQDTQDLVQEMAGYILWPELPHHGGFFLDGKGANGKSTLINLLQQMVGPSNYSCLALEEFSRNFALNATIDKLVNFASEMDPGAKLPMGTLKRFTGGDELTIDRKYQKQITFKATCKLVVAWNEKPVIKDTSDGFWRRMRMIPFLQQFKEGRNADPLLGQKLQAELSGILNWAVEGLRRLQKNGGFTVSKAGKAATENFRDQSDPVRAYLVEYWDTGSEVALPKNVVYNHYLENRHDPEEEPLAEGKFFKELYRCLPGVSAGRQRDQVGTRVPTITGIRLKESTDVETQCSPQGVSGQRV